mmetsp:Transcript_15752/g.63452  ORF Transcript_15752/g.63452 Transcript_15752/m.63452 type:complete len:212 (-) Transcript_15752:218-853(-)
MRLHSRECRIGLHGRTTTADALGASGAAKWRDPASWHSSRAHHPRHARSRRRPTTICPAPRCSCISHFRRRGKGRRHDDDDVRPRGASRGPPRRRDRAPPRPTRHGPTIVGGPRSSRRGSRRRRSWPRSRRSVGRRGSRRRADSSTGRRGSRPGAGRRRRRARRGRADRRRRRRRRRVGSVVAARRGFRVRRSSGACRGRGRATRSSARPT